MKNPETKPLVGGQVQTMDLLSSEELPVFTSDPATFLIGSNILNKVRESVSELKAMLSDAKPEFEIVLENVLARMKKIGLIDVVKDRIVILRPNPFIDLRRPDHFEFLPKVVSLVARRIQKNYMNNPKAQDDDISFRSLPDHPKVRRRILEITDRYLAEMGKLEAEVQADPSLTADRVRFCLVMTGNLEPEDF